MISIQGAQNEVLQYADALKLIEEVIDNYNSNIDSNLKREADLITAQIALLTDELGKLKEVYSSIKSNMRSSAEYKKLLARRDSLQQKYLDAVDMCDSHKELH